MAGVGLAACTRDGRCGAARDLPAEFVRRLIPALSCGIAVFLASCSGSSPSNRTAAGTGVDPTTQGWSDQLAVAAGKSFLDAYMASDGRVQRTDQGGDTVSEGQAYGMLIAAAIDDRHRFDEIWSWTQKNLELSNGLFAFHWQGGHVTSTQPASDADLDTARALLVGACRFGEPSLRAQAVRIGNAILAHETAKAGALEVLLPGPWAKQPGGLAFNPSYVDPTTLTALASATGNPRFTALASSGTKLVDDLAKPLPPDWAMVNSQTGQATPVSAAASTSGPGMFTFDAPRTLVRFAATSSPAAHAAVARAWSVFSATPPQDIVSEHQLSGAPAGSSHNPVTLAAIAGAAKAAGNSAVVLPLLAQAQRFNSEYPTYYGSAWVALGRLMLTTDRLGVCGG